MKEAERRGRRGGGLGGSDAEFEDTLEALEFGGLEGEERSAGEVEALRAILVAKAEDGLGFAEVADSMRGKDLVDHAGDVGAESLGSGAAVGRMGEEEGLGLIRVVRVVGDPGAGTRGARVGLDEGVITERREALTQTILPTKRVGSE